MNNDLNDLIKRGAVCDMLHEEMGAWGNCAEEIEALLKANDALWEIPAVDAVEVVRKPVKGYEGYYEVDRFGRVFSVDRVVSVDDNGRKYDKPLAGKQMKQTMHDKGYKVVSLTKDGKTKSKFVHRLVAEAFLDNPDDLPMVNHKDEDGTNNLIDNLEWCTREYNVNYGAAKERRAKKIRGRESKKRKPVLQYDLEGNFVARHSSVADAANIVGCSTNEISKVCLGKRKTAKGFVWKHDIAKMGGERKDDNEN